MDETLFSGVLGGRLCPPDGLGRALLQAFSIQPLVEVWYYYDARASVTCFPCPIGLCLADCARLYPGARRVSCGG